MFYPFLCDAGMDSLHVQVLSKCKLQRRSVNVVAVKNSRSSALEKITFCSSQIIARTCYRFHHLKKPTELRFNNWLSDKVPQKLIGNKNRLSFGGSDLDSECNFRKAIY